MAVKLSLKSVQKKAVISLPYSKSICNRLLILQAYSKQAFSITNISDSDDSRILQKLLSQKNKTWNVDGAGTAFRFLLSYLAITDGEHVLTGNNRLVKRPIAELVNALKQLGADINYLENEKAAPLLIKGKNLQGGELYIDASQSSQFISSLMMMGAFLPKGLCIYLVGKQVSKPYITMTASILQSLGIKVEITENTINIVPYAICKTEMQVEKDWSAASYFYSMCALLPESEFLLEGLTIQSMQGDAQCAAIFKDLGVVSTQTAKGVVIKHSKVQLPKAVKLDCTAFPDLVQSIAFCCAALKIPCHLTGLSTLNLKESERILTLKSSLQLFSIESEITDNSLYFDPLQFKCTGKIIETHNDHRIFMSIAPLALICEQLVFDSAACVSKSFPFFLNEVEKLGVLPQFSEG